MDIKNNQIAVIGRVLIGVLFLGAGLDKVFGLVPTQQFMTAPGIPAELIYPTILL